MTGKEKSMHNKMTQISSKKWFAIVRVIDVNWLITQYLNK